MGLIDIIVGFIILISVIFALYRGLLRELLGISSWILAGLGALYIYHPVSLLLQGKVENERLWNIGLSILVALIILIIMTIINAHITKKLRKSSLSGLDRLLGIAFGVARAVLLIVLVWLFTSQMAFTKTQIEKMNQDNISVVYIQQLSDMTEKLLPSHLQTDLKKKPKPAHQPTIQEVEYREKDRQDMEKMMEEMIEIEE